MARLKRGPSQRSSLSIFFPPSSVLYTMSFYDHPDSQQHSVTNQPQANLDLGSLDFKELNEKNLDASLENGHPHHCRCEHGQNSFSGHRSGRNIRLRRFLLPAIFVLVVLGGFLAWSCVNGVPAWGAELMRRDISDSDDPNNTFIHHKRQLAPL